jgi:16S rRNA processing protein RimM
LAISSNPPLPSHNGESRSRNANERQGPNDLVVMGRITAPFGIRGWVKVHPYTAEVGGLTGYPRWWIGSDESGWREHAVERAEAHADSVAAKLAGCEDREAAALYRGREVAVRRSEFPAAAENEFYWSDLVGLKVVNEQDEDLGTVARILETGANAVLAVEGDRERLIPFTEEVIRNVDLPGGVIRVDWGADY